MLPPRRHPRSDEFDSVQNGVGATLSISDRSKVLLFSCPQCKTTINATIGSQNSDWQQSLDARVVNVPCSGRIDTLQLIHAFETGADGVLVLGCEPGNCYFNTGNLHAEQRVGRAQNWLKECGMEEERIQMVYIAENNNKKKLDEVLDEFDKELKSIGKNPLKKTFPSTKYKPDEAYPKH